MAPIDSSSSFCLWNKSRLQRHIEYNLHKLTRDAAGLSLEKDAACSFSAAIAANTAAASMVESSRSN